MSSSKVDLSLALAKTVRFGEATLILDLTDGRSLIVPIQWYPRLALGTEEERADWQLIGAGQGIHWPGLDEDISVEDILAGRRSRESSESLRRWRDSRGR